MEDTKVVASSSIELAETKDRTPVELALERAGKTAGELPPAAWPSDTLLAAFVELAKIKDAAKTWLKRVEAAVAELEPVVVDYFDAEDKQKDTRRGRTIYRRRELWPKIFKEDLEEGLPPDASKELLASVDEAARQRLIEALAGDPETEHLVKAAYNSNTLRSWILNDLKEDPETLMPIVPEHLEGRLGVVEKWRATVLKS